MSSTTSVTEWIGQLKAGDRAAAERLWGRYFRRLVGLADKKLGGVPRHVADEEDVALSAFDSFCRGARRGRFPQLSDRDDLWPLLVIITARKAADLHERQGRQKRGGGAVLAEADLAGDSSCLKSVISREPTPAFIAQMNEDYERLLGRLPDADLRAIARWKMEGYTLGEIAGRLGCVPRTVRRRLERIRTIWMEELGP